MPRGKPCLTWCRQFLTGLLGAATLAGMAAAQQPGDRLFSRSYGVWKVECVRVPPSARRGELALLHPASVAAGFARCTLTAAGTATDDKPFGLSVEVPPAGPATVAVALDRDRYGSLPLRIEIDGDLAVERIPDVGRVVVFQGDDAGWLIGAFNNGKVARLGFSVANGQRVVAEFPLAGFPAALDAYRANLAAFEGIAPGAGGPPPPPGPTSPEPPRTR